MKNFTILIFLVFSVFVPLSAQMQIYSFQSLGVGHTEIKEGLLSGWVSSGTVVTTDGSLRCTLPWVEFGISEGLFLGNGSFFGILPSFQLGVDVELSSLFTIHRFVNGISLFGGAALSGGTRAFQCPSLDNMHFYWHTRYDLSIISAVDWKPVETDGLRITGRFSLLSLVSRPPASFDTLYTTDYDPLRIVGELHKELHISLPNEGFRTGMKLEWNHDISSQLTQTIALCADLWYIATPAPVTALNQSISIGYTYRMTK